MKILFVMCEEEPKKNGAATLLLESFSNKVAQAMQENGLKCEFVLASRFESAKLLVNEIDFTLIYFHYRWEVYKEDKSALDANTFVEWIIDNNKSWGYLTLNLLKIL